jgi:hypothetical protein
MLNDNINWPEEYHPENSAVHVVNSLDMDAPADKIWDCLIQATDWPQYYPNASNVEIISGNSEHRLALDTQFRWKTFGMTIETTVVEFQPYERLAWQANMFGMHVYHAWLISEQPNGCHLRTEETQNGLLPRIANLLMPGNIYKQHQIWLEGLKLAAEQP